MRLRVGEEHQHGRGNIDMGIAGRDPDTGRGNMRHGQWVDDLMKGIGSFERVIKGEASVLVKNTNTGAGTPIWTVQAGTPDNGRGNIRHGHGWII